MTLGSHIASLRVAQGLSQAELAELLEVSRQSVSKWETDTSVPELDKLLRLSQIFGVTLDDLVLGDIPEPATPAGPAQSPAVTSDVSRQPPRIMMGSILLLFGSMVALIFSLRGDPLPVSLALSLPFLSCGLICLLVKTHLPLWCGWCVCLSLYLSDIGAIGSITSLLWPNPFFLTILLVLCTAWTLRHKLWGSPRRRGLFIWGWLYAAVIYYLTRTLGFEFYGTWVLWLSQAQRLAWSRLGYSLLVLSDLLFLALATTALSALFYGLCAWLRKRRSRPASVPESAEM